MNEAKKAKEFEKHNAYPGKGIIPTPDKWISYFWDTHQEKVIRFLLPAFEKAQSILFIGVGSGDILPKMQTGDSQSIIGLDLNMKSLQNSSGYCKPIAGDGTLLPIRDKTFDLVVCNVVLHHMVVQGSLEKPLAEYSRVLKTGGKIFIFEPNIYHPSGMAMTLLNKFHLYNAVGGGSNYEYALSPFRMRRMCRAHFKNVEIKAITFSHPRFPLFMQKMIFLADSYLSGIYPLSFSFMLEATR